MLYINQCTELQKDLLGTILNVLEETAGGFYYSDLIVEHGYSFELIYTNEAREFIKENIDEVLRTLTNSYNEHGDLSFLFKNDLNIYELSTFVRTEAAQEFYYNLLNGFERETGANIWNDWIGNDLETFEAFKDYANKVYNSIDTY